MIDNPTIIAELMESELLVQLHLNPHLLTSPLPPSSFLALYSNQNTQIYGLVGEDGIWRDSEGKDLSTYDATKKGKHQGLAGLIQFAKTI